MPVYIWSQTAGSNGSIDPSINFSEGQPPASLNDSARATMAAVAKYRDDIAGAIVTAGTSTAYTVTSYSVFDTLAHLNGQMIAFSPHATNTAGSPSVTLNVDGLGAKPIRSAPGVDISSGTIIQGTPYLATYNNADGAFYLQGFYGNPYNVPLAAGLDFWGFTAPNSSFAFPFGQAISRTTYATLFALVGISYGAGDGSTTFNLPDKRGRVSACIDNMGGTDSGRLGDANSSIAAHRLTVGGAAGAVTHQVTVNELPSHAHANTLSDPGHAHIEQFPIAGGGSAYIESVGGSATSQLNTLGSGGIPTQAAGTGISINNAAQGGSATHENVQPTILCNYIIRIL